MITVREIFWRWSLFGGSMGLTRTSDLIFFNSGVLPNILHYITLPLETFPAGYIKVHMSKQN